MGRDTQPWGQTLHDIVGDAVWRALLRTAFERHHPADDLLLRQGDPGTHLLAVVSGIVKVVRTERNGDLILLAFRGPGELVGEGAVLGGGGRLASVRTVSACRVAVVDRATFMRFATSHQLFPALTRYALGRLGESDRARTGGDPLPRLVSTLVRIAEMSGQADDPLTLRLSRDDLAQYLRISRNTVTAKLAELETHGVGISRRSIVIRDLDALRRAGETLDASG
ncbi:Crp/Fnr family transcriptional regulator [Streptomyces sp. 4N509B]|uniref:Crp/Fnr family transcriptional regulator n=1 Tax=Streptomyces sp. 4N509B TaxID=3457413 RepID=UPI003FD15F08